MRKTMGNILIEIPCSRFQRLSPTLSLPFEMAWPVVRVGDAKIVIIQSLYWCEGDIAHSSSAIHILLLLIIIFASWRAVVVFGTGRPCVCMCHCRPFATRDAVMGFTSRPILNLNMLCIAVTMSNNVEQCAPHTQPRRRDISFDSRYANS